MGYIADVINYMSGTECPESYLTWAALSLAGATAARKVWVKHGDYFDIYPNLYVCLVGTPGSGKSVAKDLSRDLMFEVWPEYPISAEIQSHQHICKEMASPDGGFTWTDEVGILGFPGKIQLYRPYYAMPDELQLFLSTDKAGMMGFMVAAHSSKTFKTGFKRDEGLPQILDNPFFSVLACTTPEWFMGNLRVDLFTGGAGRRFCIVYDKKTIRKPRPKKPPKASETYGRILKHLHDLRELKGQLVLDPDAYGWWDKWYMSIETWAYRDDPIVHQFHETKHIILLKLATLIALDTLPSDMVVREVHLRAALALLNSLEPNVVHLTSGIGRNELAGIAAQILDSLAQCDGEARFKKFKDLYFRHLRTQEWQEVIAHLADTNKIVILRWPPLPQPDRPSVDYILLPANYQKLMRDHGIDPATGKPEPEKPT